MNCNNLKNDTEELYKKLCKVKYDLRRTYYIIYSCKVPYNKEKLLDTIIYFINTLNLLPILDIVHYLCWNHNNDESEETLKDGITKDMVPFKELWQNNDWLFYRPSEIRKERIIDKCEKHPPENQISKEYVGDLLPQDKKYKIIYYFKGFYQYYDQYCQYYLRYGGRHKGGRRDIKNYFKDIKKCIHKLEKAPINKLDLARKRLVMSKMDICDDLLIKVNNILIHNYII